MKYRKQFLSSYDALKYYGLIRTKNKKGVTIPSQIRYVHYFERALTLNWSIKNLPTPEVELTKIRLSTIPNFNIFGGCGIIQKIIINLKIFQSHGL